MVISHVCFLSVCLSVCQGLNKFWKLTACASESDFFSQFFITARWGVFHNSAHISEKLGGNFMKSLSAMYLWTRKSILIKFWKSPGSAPDSRYGPGLQWRRIVLSECSCIKYAFECHAAILLYNVFWISMYCNVYDGMVVAVFFLSFYSRFSSIVDIVDVLFFSSFCSVVSAWHKERCCCCCCSVCEWTVGSSAASCYSLYSLSHIHARLAVRLFAVFIHCNRRPLPASLSSVLHRRNRSDGRCYAEL